MTSKLLTFTASDWDDLIAEMEVGQIEDGEITAEMLVAMMDRPISRDNASHKLSVMYERGRATRRWVLVDGKKRYAYRKVKK